MYAWSGILYSSGTISSSGTSATQKFPGGGLLIAARFFVTATGVAGDETLVVKLRHCFDSSDTGEVAIIQCDEINSGAATDLQEFNMYLTSPSETPWGPYYNVNHTVAGTGPSMSYEVHASMILVPS